MLRSAEEFVEKLIAAEFAITEWSPLGGGQNNLAILANDEWVFRTPIHSNAAESLESEVAILEAIHGRLPVQTPKPEIVVEVEGCEWSVVGYPYLPGRSLGREELSGLGREKQVRLGKDLGRILTTLHSTSTGQLPSSLPKNRDDAEHWDRMGAEARELLKPRLESRIWNKVNRKISGSIEKIKQFNFDPVLRHGDFGSGNFLFDSRDRLIGVIDFGSSGFGDAAMDVAGVISSTVPVGQLLEPFSTTYELGDDIIERANTYRETFAFQEALLGAKSDDVLAIESGLGDYVGN